jgi:hypothetical protein
VEEKPQGAADPQPGIAVGGKPGDAADPQPYKEDEFQPDEPERDEALAGADQAAPAAADPTGNHGPGKPARPMTRRQQGAAQKRAAKDAAEKELDDDAQEGATRWWEYATDPKRFGPWVGSKGAFPAIRLMIRRALAAKNPDGTPAYTREQIWEALQKANRVWPSAGEWERALAHVSGRKVPGQQRGPGAAPRPYDDTQYERSTERPEELTPQQIDELLGRTG